MEKFTLQSVTEGVIFDWTFTFGNLATILTFLAVGASFIYGLKSDLRSVGDKVKGIEADIVKIDKTLDQVLKLFVELARQEERISSLHRRVSDIAERTMKLEVEANAARRNQ